MDRRSPGDDRPLGCAPNRLSRLVGKGLLGFQAYIRVVGTQRREDSGRWPRAMDGSDRRGAVMDRLGIAAVCLFLVGRWLENRFADSH